MKVYICQLLCPHRHCILAVANEYEHATEATALLTALEQQFQKMVTEKVLNAKCDLCGSTQLNYELMPSKFASMEEAMPMLLELQEAQRQTREYLKGSRN